MYLNAAVTYLLTCGDLGPKRPLPCIDCSKGETMSVVAAGVGAATEPEHAWLSAEAERGLGSEAE